MKHIIVLCFVILCCCETLFSQDAHKGKEFYFAELPWGGFECVLMLSSDTVTKGYIVLHKGGSLTDTLYFSLKQAQQPIIIKYDGSKIGLRGGDHRSNSFIHNLQPQKLSLYIRAEHDIQATCLTGPNGNGNEITLLYPVKAYGKEYVVVAPQSKYFTYTDNNNKIVQNYLYSQCCIVATENNTSITIESPVNLLGASERTLTATLQKGESYLIQARPSALDTAADLTGMRIVASAPIAVYSGGILGFGTHPTNKWFSINNTSESLLPISSYGQRYIVIDPVKSRNEDDLGSNYHKIVAMTDTATIYVNGNKISKLQKGESIVLPLNKYSLVYGTSPIAVIVLRRSSYSDIDYYHDEIPNTYGNPFMTDIAPQEYWQKSYDIFMDYQKEYDGMIFPDNYIDIIVPTSAINQITMNGKAVNKNLFKPLPSFPSSGFCSELSYATIMTRPSSLRLECNVPFGISCYGYGPLKSAYYAYGYVPGRSMNNASLSHPIVKTSVSDTTMCAGQSLQLQAYGGDGTFEWSPKEGLSCTDCPSPIATITKDILYTAVSKDYFGCPTMKQSVSVRVKTATVKASEDLGICAGDSIQLTVNEGLSYSWTPSNTLSCSDCRSPFARPTTQQTYYVTMTDKYGCVGIDSVTVSVGKPIADAGKDTIICAGSSVQIFASGGNYYRWEQSPDLSCSDCANPIISPKQSQYYRMRSFISANCYADDSVFITVEKATANIIASKLRYCKQDSIQLRVEGGKSVQWRGAGINCIDCREQKFIAPQSGYYYAEITTDNNCTAQDSVYITINTPQMTVSADTTICRGTSAKMWARGNGRFVWSPPQGLSCTDCDSPLASPTESTEYTVLLYDADNCIASEKVWVYVDSCVIQTQDTITVMASLDCETISAEKTYIHLSDNPLTVQSPIFIRGNTNAFFVEYSVPPGTQLSRNDICKISITMIEKNQGTYSAEYSIGEGKSTKLNVFIQGKYEEKRANIRPHDTTDIIAGSRIPVRLFMENKESGLQEIVMTISYPSRFMKYTDKSLQSIVTGEFIVEKTEEKEGFEYVTIRGKGIDIYPSEQEIARFEADTYLGDSSSFTVLTSTQTTNECYRIAPSKATISMGGCFIEGRTVTTGQPYTMTSRVEDNQLILDYTAGLDGKTECTLINSMGEIVGEPIQRVDIRGEYQLIYSLSNLANGIYIVNFRSGFYTKNECIIYVR